MNKKLSVSTFLLTIAMAASAFAYPDKPVTYVIPFSPGGESDTTAQMQAPFFEALTGQPMKFKYAPGGGGAKSWSMLNRFPADGHTVVTINLPHIITQPLLGKVGYATDDLNPVHFFHYTPDAILVKKNSPLKTFADFVAAAKAKPGALKVSGSGKYSANNIAQLALDKKAGIKTNYTGYKGSSAAMVGLLGGQVDAAWSYTTSAVTYGDDVRMLAVAMEERHPAFPDTPTFKELGYDWVGGAYRGAAVPKATPDAISQKLSDRLAEINNDPEFRRQMVEAGFALINIEKADMSAYMAQMTDRYTSLLQELGIAP
ncbi:tripartite tricarboxylate transporter substrate binding protein [Granulosicoccus antarcticus]|uniref:Tripartite tricarboxylate transporter family receptor n=1 Tax=Granulosicoccus antarcticus IMCC3135 TaxID=1192854 RepID=A0A2Z2P4I0_9GAMM|nr:tripartite tricarboxylate transporter substrate binding protein [Granulosicoccus antarcticus]ASJ76350.1 hypothetical protein IMCC3135_31515 [Granulosicoccus antarcticus IMCC3135]